MTDGAGDINAQLLASLGHFIRLGKGSAPQSRLKENMTFTSIDFESMAYTKPGIIAE